jgi:hypothetical protein
LKRREGRKIRGDVGESGHELGAFSHALCSNARVLGDVEQRAGDVARVLGDVEQRAGDVARALDDDDEVVGAFSHDVGVHDGVVGGNAHVAIFNVRFITKQKPSLSGQFHDRSRIARTFSGRSKMPRSDTVGPSGSFGRDLDPWIEPTQAALV